MRKISLLLILCLSFGLCACSEQTSPESGTNASSASLAESNPNTAEADTSKTDRSGKILVAYFSATGNTKPIAEYIGDITGGTLFEIAPQQPYSPADLDYRNDCRANREQNDASSRPAVKKTVSNMDDYETVFLGYPIWWGKLPKIIYTFLEAYDFSGKTVIPFCTSGSSGIATSVGEMQTLLSDATVENGKRFSPGADKSTVEKWINELKLPLVNNTPDHEKEKIMFIKVYCKNNVLNMELADNPSAKAFAEALQKGDITVTMNDYGDFEKVGSLGFSLPQTDKQIDTEPGDVILYQGKNITVYYDTNSWNFTRLGKIPNMTRETMLAFFGGKGEVTVTFSIK